ncbi:hypothetical protein NE237_029113 [Protea cynaroides]|uniref:Uncharacterized protein n=1 Tax=Protea cynaroides TaxID=273540 RepID=A0A9Q0GQK9_9MAGN|nr:hypothetical protein NE237_029113 [Protea cynaroides]
MVHLTLHPISPSLRLQESILQPTGRVTQTALAFCLNFFSIAGQVDFLVKAIGTYVQMVNKSSSPLGLSLSHASLTYLSSLSLPLSVMPLFLCLSYEALHIKLCTDMIKSIGLTKPTPI